MIAPVPGINNRLEYLILRGPDNDEEPVFVVESAHDTYAAADAALAAPETNDLATSEPPLGRYAFWAPPR